MEQANVSPDTVILKITRRKHPSTLQTLDWRPQQQLKTMKMLIGGDGY